MGCLYGAKLSAVAENSVYLLDVWQEHIDAVNSRGLMMESDGKSEKYENLVACSQSEYAGEADLALIFVKSTLTKQAVESSKHVFGPGTAVLTLQNGLGNIELISGAVGRGRVIAGTTAHGATMIGPGKIRHAGRGKTVIGELDGTVSERISAICNAFDKAGIETEITRNVLGVVWDKLLVNVGINALTGITGLLNGQLLEYPELEELLEAAVREGEAVAKALGVKLEFDDPVAHTKEVCRATAKNKASMLQDILNHRKTEIEMINGAIVREGRKLSINVPVNTALTNLIKFREKQVD
jgi:2-dehydropantoate 2-reductase